MQYNLAELFKQYGTDKLGHGYAPHYERYLDPLRTKALLEIGVNTGASLRAWRAWLPPAATVTGLDINASDPIPNVTLIQGDVTYPATAAPLPMYDVIIDDASHVARDISMALDLLWEHLNPGGWYVIEDLAAPQAGRAAVLPLLRKAATTEVHIHGEIAFGRKP